MSALAGFFLLFCEAVSPADTIQRVAVHVAHALYQIPSY